MCAHPKKMDGRTAESLKSNNVFKLIFCGDFCLAGEAFVAELQEKRVEPWRLLLQAMGENATIVGNLECAISEEGQGLPFKWANLKMSPRLHYMLDGLSVAVLGNNHIGDFGARGVNDTHELLADKGIQAVGQGETLSDALKPLIIDIDGRRLGIVSLCCPTTNCEYLATHQSAGVAPLGMATLKQAIDGARDQCDALAVFLHWGCEWVHDPAPDQLRLARQAIDCGADAVLGCHSHTIQSYEQYKGRWIFYGLGNYLFNAGEAQSIRADGMIERIPLTLKPENRESLAVAFRISDTDKGQGRLVLDRVQPMRFGDDFIP